MRLGRTTCSMPKLHLTIELVSTETSMSNVIPFLSGLTPSIIAEEEVTIPRLSSVLDAAFIDHEIDEDGDIYVSDGVEFPLWIDLLSDRKLVNLFTYLRFDDQREANWLTRVNEMNSKIMLPQFSYCRGSIWGAYWMTFEGGLNIRQFVKMLRNFSGAFTAGISIYREEAPQPKLTLVEPPM